MDQPGKDVRVHERKRVFDQGIFRIDQARLQFRRFDGHMSAELVRMVLERGDSAAVLLHDPADDRVLLCEQFRYPAHVRGNGWLLEIPAGIVSEGETPEACARRETHEETGQVPGTLQRIATVFPSPGGSSERVHLFYAPVPLEERSAPAGLEDEGEDIRVALVPTREALAMLADGRIVDAKTVIALQWLGARSASS